MTCVYAFKPFSYRVTKLFLVFLCQICHQHVQLGRAVLRHARAAQRLVVRQRIHAARADSVHEPLLTHVQLAVGSVNALLDAEHSVRSGGIVNGDGSAGHGDDGDATVIIQTGKILRLERNDRGHNRVKDRKCIE